MYSLIEKKIISKEFVREKFLEYGLINFLPKNVNLGIAEEVFKNGVIVILNLDNEEIKIGEKLLVEKKNEFEIVNIVGIQVNGKDVESVKSGEVGVRLDKPIERKSKIMKLI